MNFVDLIKNLQDYWQQKGCVLLQPSDIEVGAGTFHPATFFGALSDNPVRTSYVQPSRRPADGRYGDNPLRTQFYYQYQVILKPSPDEVRYLYLKSLEKLGINIAKHDIRFVEDDWESPTLGASGLGWEVWLDSLEITQFTYFQQIGGFELNPITAEITYGLERICMFTQQINNIYDLKWDDNLTYGDLHKKREIENCKYNFETADINLYRELFEKFEKESARLNKEGLLYPSYEMMLKTSHIFNILDARQAVSVGDRMNYIRRVRNLSKSCAKLYLKKVENERNEK